MKRIAVITPSLPERRDMLLRVMDDVAGQTLQPVAHIVGVDFARRGHAAARQGLAMSADADWLAFVDDDDRIMPHHLETLAAHDGDVIYTRCEVVGRAWDPWVRTFNPALLRAYNFIPVTALVNADMFRKAGGFRTDDTLGDWELWVRMLDAGAVFTPVDEVTWVYNFGHPQVTNGFSP